jgi:Fe(3+) dicitrate transport protein
VTSLLLALALGADAAESPASDAAEAEDGDDLVITVVGATPRALAGVPGAAAVVTKEQLDAMRPLHGGEVLQTVPGVAVVDEDGFGLRQNIGIRGLSPNRSRKVLVLEDGIPISLAPYGEPELYWAPTIDRMERVEIVKGSGSILFGPQTIGGVINYVTPDPPRELELDATARVGSFGLLEARGSAGGTRGAVGALASVTAQRFRGPRDLDLQRLDGNLKVVWRPADDQAVVAKAGAYGERSRATYLGLTTPQFEADPRISLASHDLFTVDRLAGSLQHVWFASDRFVVRTVAYGHVVDRDWRRQDFDRADFGADYERVYDGAGRDVTADTAAWPTDGSGIYFRNGASSRDRLFHVVGLQSEARGVWRLGEVRAGARVHLEHTSEQRVEGDAPDVVDEVVSDSTRWGRAVAVWGQQRLSLADDRLEITPGMRLEVLSAEVLLHRWRVPTEAGTVPVDFDPPRRAPQLYTAVLPGLGAAWHQGDLTLFGGVHRGFSPPRTKDAVTSDGDPIELGSETSWNGEAGARWLSDAVRAEVAGFVLDFANQVIEPSEAGGAVADAASGGRTLHAGVEAAVTADPLHGGDVTLPLSVSYTYTRATFGEGWGLALLGQPLPYAPEHTLVASAGFGVPWGLSGQVKLVAVGPQYGDTVATVDPTVDGLVGRIPGRATVDARLGWLHRGTGIEVSVVAKNALDARYIASRAPRGIQPGPPRLVMGELSWHTPARSSR